MAATEATRLLKANDIRGVGSKVLFNFEDLKTQCEEHLALVKAQAEKMLAEAAEEAVRLRQATFDAARQEGFEAGMRESQARITAEVGKLADRLASERMSTILPGLRQATDALIQERDRCLERWETASLKLAVTIAEKLIRRQLNTHPETALGMIRGALELAAGAPKVRLRLHPDDLAFLGAGAQDAIRLAAGSDEAALTPDLTVSRGGCVVETRHGTIDARLETMLERITEELLH